MYATANKKMLNMLILEILKEHSDENHPLTQQQILRILKRDYGMECDRRSVKNNLEYLQEFGYEISMEKGYYLMEREFEDSELRFLIDAVLFSKGISGGQARDLIEKLKKQSSKYFEPKLTHISYLPELHKVDNKQLMYVIGVIEDAIESEKKISFIYNDYDTDFKLHPRREKRYIMNPYQLIINNGRYYLLGNYDNYDNVAHCRVDRITDVVISEEPRKLMKCVKGLEKGINLPKHMAEHMYLFGGEGSRILMKAKKSIFNDLVDWFGTDFSVLSEEKDWYKISVSCSEEAMFLWAMQYNTNVEILEPINLREKIGERAREMAEKYGK